MAAPPYGRRVRMPLNGINQQHRGPSGSVWMENVSADPNGGWRTSGGFEALDPSNGYNGGDYRIRSIHWFAQHNGARYWYLYEEETATSGEVDLKYVRPGFTTPGTIQSGRKHPPGPVMPTQYLDHLGWVYVLSRFNRPIRWNGRVSGTGAGAAGVQYAGFDRTPPPPEVNESGSEVQQHDSSAYLFTAVGETGWYDIVEQRGLGHAADEEIAWLFGYRVAWVNDLGQESPPSDVTWVSGRNPANVQVAGTWFGKGRASVRLVCDRPPWNVRGIRVYRTSNRIIHGGRGSTETTGLESLYTSGQAAAEFFFHSEYAAADELHLWDDVPDSELGEALDPHQSGLWPQGASMGVVFKECLFLAGMPEEADAVAHSVPFFIEQIPARNRLRGGNAGGAVTGLKAVRNGVIVYRRSGIDIIRGDPVNGWERQPLTQHMGHVGGPVIDVPEQGQLFWGEDGPYIMVLSDNTFEATQIRYVGGPIRRTWMESINLLAMPAATGVVLPWQREVWVQVPWDGSDLTTYGLVYHYERGGWSTRAGYPIQCMTEVRDHRRIMAFGSWDTVDQPGLHVYHEGIEELGLGEDVTVSSTIRIKLATEDRRIIYHAEIYTLPYNRPITVKWRKDRHLEFESVFAADGSTLRTIDTEYDREVWDTALWDPTKIYADYSPVLLRMDFDGANCLEFQLSLQGTRFHLLEVDLFVEAPHDIPKQEQGR